MLLIIDKTLIVVSATIGGKFIISFVIFIGTPAGIANDIIAKLIIINLLKTFSVMT